MRKFFHKEDAAEVILHSVSDWRSPFSTVGQPRRKLGVNRARGRCGFQSQTSIEEWLRRTIE